MRTNLTFGEALVALKQGKRVARTGWNGPDLFVFMQVPSTIAPEVVPKMTSLPEIVKAELSFRGLPLQYSNQMALVKPNSEINGWAPSAADALAEDWVVVEDGPEGPGVRPPHEQRVFAEKEQLDDRLMKLGAFLEGPVFLGLPAAEQSRLQEQLQVMGIYSDILTERIKAFPAHR